MQKRLRGSNVAAGEEEEVCPVCRDPLGLELVMLPCGHSLCCKCTFTLTERQNHVMQVKRLTLLVQYTV